VIADEREELRAARHIFAVRLDDESLLWDERTEQLHRLNPSATLVWDAFSDWSTVQVLSARLAASSHLGAEGIAECVYELRALGLLDCRTVESDQSPPNRLAEFSGD
jgi:hypothetical protein